MANAESKRIVVTSYGCVSAAGRGVDVLFDALRAGQDLSDFVDTANWPVELTFQPRACSFRKSGETLSRDILLTELLWAFGEAQSRIPAPLAEAKIGVILASTKSFVDDFIWTCGEEELEHDAMSRLLSDFLEKTKIKAHRSLCVSNACASSLSAVYLAKKWLQSGDVSDVWVLAADRIGPFVLHGFNSLHALTAEKARPFAANRSGLQLGDGAVALLLSTGVNAGIALQGAGIDAEGVSATRPSASGDSLKRACLQIEGIEKSPPDLIIAHGTATPLNDPAEDQAFLGLFGDGATSPLITATKWCLGHTLGASGALDLIAACEVLQRQELFVIANTHEVDAIFRGRYLFAGHQYQRRKLNKVLVTSLGFGGVNAAAMLEKLKE